MFCRLCLTDHLRIEGCDWEERDRARARAGIGGEPLEPQDGDCYDDTREEESCG